jgi:hypothetical protein
VRLVRDKGACQEVDCLQGAHVAAPSPSSSFPPHAFFVLVLVSVQQPCYAVLCCAVLLEAALSSH